MTGRIIAACSRSPIRQRVGDDQQQQERLHPVRLKTVRDYGEEESQGGEEPQQFPPKYTYLILEKRKIIRRRRDSSGTQEDADEDVGSVCVASSYAVAFSDPRKFGSAQLYGDLSPFDELAPDAYLELSRAARRIGRGDRNIFDKLVNQTTGIKAILLDQKRAVSGVGNWVADEVCYQCRLHPDQTHLTDAEVVRLLETLQSVLQQAVGCLKNGVDFPPSWLFHYRWTKKKAGSKDSEGRSITFIVRLRFSVVPCFFWCGAPKTLQSGSRSQYILTYLSCSLSQRRHLVVARRPSCRRFKSSAKLEERNGACRRRHQLQR